MEKIILSVVAAVALLGAFVGIVLPGLPGIPLLWILLAIDHWLLGYLSLTGATMAWLTVIAVATMVIDHLATALGVKKRGGSLLALAGSIVGLIGGLLLFNIPGMLMGCFLGALAGEMLHGSELDKAANIALGALLGYAVATAIKLASWAIYAVVIFTAILR